MIITVDEKDLERMIDQRVEERLKKRRSLYIAMNGWNCEKKSKSIVTITKIATTIEVFKLYKILFIQQ